LSSRLKYLLLLFFFFSLREIKSQEFTGYVLEKTSKTAVPGCVVILKGTTIASTSNADGKFVIALPLTTKDPILVFNLLGYYTTEYNLYKHKGDTFYISQRNFQLEEVVIPGKKKNILNPQSQEVILDFDFLNENLVILTSGAGKNNLRLMDESGKTISKISVDKNCETLQHDCLENLQLFSSDSVWQVFYDFTKLNLLKAFPISKFKEVLGNCVCCKDGNYYFREMKYRNLRTEYFYFSDKEKGVRKELAKFQDTARIKSFETDYDLQYFLTVRKESNFTMYAEPLEELKKKMEFYREQLSLDWAYLKFLGSVETQLVKQDENLFIADFTDSAIFSISPQQSVNYSCRFSCMKNKHLQHKVYADPVSKETYLVTFSGDKLSFIKFDIRTGKEISKTELKKIPYLPRKIIIYGGKAFFIEKNLSSEQVYKVVKFWLS
jgi:hypothetical protein